ncbi:hypothetical protein MLD38_006914 [Melastoma candidum]|uniref:Uncharacterized protein n=1 Tax=Melastoma candidum TaxID=119954 RepID=A0ACB9RQN6_9MYRT|nr:hypothetical protein MLD38_006914 [Melastoma candidum]
MGVRIRLARFGCRNRPFYRFIAANSRSPSRRQPSGGSRVLPSLARYWLSVCAQPLDPVQNPLFRARVFPPPSILAMGHEGGPRDMRPVDPLTGRVITDKAATNAAVASALDNLNVLKFQFTATSA